MIFPMAQKNMKNIIVSKNVVILDVKWFTWSLRNSVIEHFTEGIFLCEYLVFKGHSFVYESYIMIT